MPSGHLPPVGIEAASAWASDQESAPNVLVSRLRPQPPSPFARGLRSRLRPATADQIPTSRIIDQRSRSCCGHPPVTPPTCTLGPTVPITGSLEADHDRPILIK